jgi:hypothetical protein
MWDFKFSRRRVWCSELSFGLYEWSHPWWWRQYAPLKRRSTIILHGSITQKTTLNIEIRDDVWVLTPHRLVGRYQHFGESHCLCLQGCFHFQNRTWRDYISPKQCYIPISLHTVITQNSSIIISAVRTSKLKYFYFLSKLWTAIW